MFSLKKRIFSIVILLIVAGTFYYLYNLYYQKYINEEPLAFDISPEAVGDKCLKDFEEMSEDDFLESIKVENIEFSGTLTLEEVDERMHEFDKAKVAYLICRVKHTKDDLFYDRAKEYILGERNISEETKKFVVDYVNEYQKNPEAKKNFLTELALGDMEKICPLELKSLCTRDFRSENSEISCPNYCSLIQELSSDNERFNRDVFEYENWKNRSLNGDSSEGLTSRRIKVRLALVFQIEDQDIAKQFCQLLPEDSLGDVEYTAKKFCFDELESIMKSLKSEDCKELQEEISEIICTK